MSNSLSQQRKFFNFIPIPVAAFITVIFILLGGAGGDPVAEVSDQDSGQFSTNVPTGRNETATLKDKISAYFQSDAENQNRKAQQKRDNHFQYLYDQDTTRQKEEDIYAGRGYAEHPNNLAFKSKEVTQELEKEQEKLDTQLELLEKRLKNKKPNRPRSRPAAPPSEPEIDDDLARQLSEYERAQTLSGHSDTGSILGDDFAQMSQMLQTITDIQHPEQVAERLRQQSLENRGEFYSVAALETEVPISYLGQREQTIYQERFDQYIKDKADSTYRTVSEQSITGFMGLNSSSTTLDEKTVSAVVHGTQQVTAGSTVTLRLQDPIVVAGHRVEAGSFIFGTAEFSGPRVVVNISSIVVDETVVPVAMDVYDQGDGMQGIFIPDIAASVAAQQAAGQATSSLRLSMANPNLATRAVDEGLRGIKSLVRMKANQTKATLKNNYEIVLLNQKKL